MAMKMLKTTLLGIGLLIGAIFLSGCDQTSSTLGGAAVGTAAGAGIGYAIGNGGGAALGGVLGGLTGAAMGHNMGN